jgi:hypothetical protein
MLGVTLLGILLTPVFYYVVVRLVGTKAAAPPATHAAGELLHDRGVSGNNSDPACEPLTSPAH